MSGDQPPTERADDGLRRTAPVPAKGAPIPSGGSARERPGWWRWRRLTVIVAIVIVAMSAATARLFVWPAQGMPPKVSAIVMLDYPGVSLSFALRLAGQHRASFLLISLGMPLSGSGCPRPRPPIADITMICFNPSPATTQGEAEFVGRQARKYHWHSVAVVTIAPQASRARLRIERCFAGPVYVVTTPIALGSWPHQVVYEWGALVKALTLQRGC